MDSLVAFVLILFHRLCLLFISRASSSFVLMFWETSNNIFPPYCGEYPSQMYRMFPLSPGADARKLDFGSFPLRESSVSVSRKWSNESLVLTYPTACSATDFLSDFHSRDSSLLTLVLFTLLEICSLLFLSLSLSLCIYFLRSLSLV